MRAQPSIISTRSRILGGVVLAAIALLMLGGQARGGQYLNTMESTAALHGRAVDVTVIEGCDATQRLALRVTATQRRVGAVAQGTAQTTCAGDAQHVVVHLYTTGAVDFVPTAEAREDQIVEVCALATTMTRGKVDDSHQWCKDLELVAS